METPGQKQKNLQLDQKKWSKKREYGQIKKDCSKPNIILAIFLLFNTNLWPQS